MVEEIITALSRIRWLFVIAHNSSFTYKSQAIDTGLSRTSKGFGAGLPAPKFTLTSGDRPTRRAAA